MKKLIQFALSAAFPNSNTEGLLEVINSTANPDIATEMVLGIYEKPELQSTLPQRRESQINLEIIEVDYIRQRVKYFYNQKETTYSIKDSAGKQVEETNSSYRADRILKENPEYTADSTVVIKEKKSTDYMDIEQWIELQEKRPQVKVGYAVCQE